MKLNAQTKLPALQGVPVMGPEGLEPLTIEGEFIGTWIWFRKL